MTESSGDTSIEPPNPWWDAAWACRTPFTITPPDTLGALPDGVVLMRLPSSRIETARVSDQGEDIRLVTAAHDDEFDFEVDQWASDESTLWVRVDPLQPGVATDGWIYHGNPSAPALAASATWTGPHDLVLHLGEDLFDSVGSRDAAHYSATPPPATIGRISQARRFDDNRPAQVLRPEDTQTFDYEDGFSASVWFRVFPVASDQVRRGFMGVSGWGVEAYDPGADFDDLAPLDLRFRTMCVSNPANCYPGTEEEFILLAAEDTRAESGAWHHFGVSFNASGNSTFQFYVDGDLVGEHPFSGELAPPSLRLALGMDPETTSLFNGHLDEFRFSDEPWPAERFAADFATVNENFVSYGTPECFR